MILLSFTDLLILAAGLSADAFAVSVCKGLSIGKTKLTHALCAGLWFGIFQAVMPLLGFFLGRQFSGAVNRFSHWIAFFLLVFIGINMIKESFDKDEEQTDASMSVGQMLPLAIATSIDALAVGVTFAFLKTPVLSSVCVIGAVTFCFSAAGIKIGGIFGDKYKTGAQRIGGMILILLGVKILLSGLGIF